MEQDSEVWDPGHGAKNTQIRWEACGGLECWLAPGGQGGTSSTTPPLGWGLYPFLLHTQSSKPEAQSQGLQAQDHSRRKTCPCSWNQVKSGCKLACQKPKGRVTSTVREAVAVS